MKELLSKAGFLWVSLTFLSTPGQAGESAAKQVQRSTEKTRHNANAFLKSLGPKIKLGLTKPIYKARERKRAVGLEETNKSLQQHNPHINAPERSGETHKENAGAGDAVIPRDLASLPPSVQGQVSQDPNKATFIVSDNRCQVGVLKIGNQWCYAKNAGSGKGNTDATGSAPNGAACTFKKGPPGGQGNSSSIGHDYNKPLYVRRDSPNFTKGVYGSEPPIALGAGGVVQIHSLRSLPPNINRAVLEDPNLKSSGCIITSHECMKAFGSYLEGGGGNPDIEVVEVPGLQI